MSHSVPEPAGSGPVPVPGRLGRACRVLAVCYAVPAGVGCVYAFCLSAALVRPVFPLPVWMMPGLAAAWLWLYVPLPLLFVGLIHVFRAARRGWLWSAAWVSAMAGGIVLEGFAMSGPVADWLIPDPAYPPPPGLSWVSLAEGGGFLAVGVAMFGILAVVERRRRVAGGRGRCVRP